MRVQAAVGDVAEAPGLDLLRVPVVGRFLRGRWSRIAVQSVMLLVAVAMILHGFFGPDLAPKNLATLFTWVHYRGLLVLVLLVAGNFFCYACPFMLPRELARRFFKPVLNWPQRLRNKWVAIAVFVSILFAYELFDLWGAPFWTAWLIVGYFVGALVVDSLFKNASFCKHVCPIGQFNFVAATMSPLEVAVRDPEVCAACTTVDCIRGTRDEEDPSFVLQRGCELALFQPAKVGNLDCTFCMDCVRACPHDNIAITTRLPGSELWDDRRRSGIGLLANRKDVSALAVVFTFGALLNAFGMVSPVYAVETWLAARLHTTIEAPVLGTLFVFALLVEPAVLMGSAAWAMRRSTGTSEKLLAIAARYAYALIPIGFAVWVSHYSFHLFTGALTFIPVLQGMLMDAGINAFGSPHWGIPGMLPGQVYPMELGFLSLGMLGSLLVAFRISERDYPEHAWKAFLPWATLCLLLSGAAVWLMSQPMEMRGAVLGS